MTEIESEINEFFYTIPSAKNLKRMTELSKTFSQPGSLNSPTFNDVKRIVKKEMFQQSLQGETYIELMIFTKFGSEMTKHLQELGFQVARTKKDYLLGREAQWYVISWAEEDDVLTESPTQEEVKKTQ